MLDPTYGLHRPRWQYQPTLGDHGDGDVITLLKASSDAAPGVLQGNQFGFGQPRQGRGAFGYPYRGKRLKDILTTMGLTSGLELCLDAGDSASFAGGASWLDTSGNGFDFFRGAASASGADDPMFEGVYGRKSRGDFFECDGADQFAYDAANEAWMNNLHKDGAMFTIALWYYRPAGSGDVGLFGTTGAAGIGTRLYQSGASEIILTGNYNNADAHNIDVSSGLGAIVASSWNFVSLSLTEATGAGGLLFNINGSTASLPSTYTTPTASDAAQPFAIGSNGNLASPVRNGTRFAQFMAWEGVALTASQLAALFAATRGRFGV